MDKKYIGLRLIGKISRILGFAGFALAIVSLIVAPIALSSSDDLLANLTNTVVQPGTGLTIGVLFGIFFFLILSAVGMLLFALSECFTILIEIERNTRIAGMKSNRG